MGVVHDLSPPISPALAVWPGDTPPSREVLCDIARGGTITLSTLRTTVHAGSHADAPSHYARHGRTIDAQRLDHYLGECQVIDAPVARGTRVGVGDLRAPVTSPRVLIRTGTFPDPAAWNKDFAALSVELIEHLASRGVITVGIDTPSVDLFDSKDLPAHAAIFRADAAILEGLVLRDVTPGRYELIALPLKLTGFDASPVRAILRELPPGE